MNRILVVLGLVVLLVVGVFSCERIDAGHVGVKVNLYGSGKGVNDMVIGNDIGDNNTPAIVDIALDVNDEWYYGRHGRIEDVIMNARGEYNIVKAIIL
jgi:hypothetical protein